MKTWTVHTKAGRTPELLPEGFSLTAMVLGPVWLLAQRAWVPAVLLGCAQVAGHLLVPGAYGLVVSLGLAWICGVVGRDWVRWSLERRGYALSDVVAASSLDLAFGRILTARPGLIEGFPT